MYKLKFRHKLKLALNKYKRLIILLAAFLITSLVIIAVYANSSGLTIPGIYDTDPVTLVIGLGGLVVIFILVFLD